MAAGGGGVVRVLSEVETSPQDERAYRAIEIQDNKLQVLLIHDPEADKASCAMDVAVGSLFDGDVMGLAHFCEHMLFLGTEAFPDEQAYSKFLNQHGGRSNAYTDMEHTVYYFDVTPDHLKGVLDRFSAFFVSPLFTASATSREMKAVDSENEKSLQQDMWRVHMIHCALARSDHPITRFRCGNLHTLLEEPKERGVDVRDRLLAFHAKYYSSNIMRLVVLGKEPLDELQEMVVSRFTPVKNLDIPTPNVPGIPYGVGELSSTVVEVVPVMELRSLDMFWPLPPQRKHYLQSPARYVSHLLGHEGEGSIISFLKAKGWANELSAGPQYDHSEWSSMDVSVELTDQGVEHVQDVIKTVYHYIHTVLRSSGPQEWVWEEVRQMSENRFRFLSKSPPIHYTPHLATNMHKYPPQHVVSGPHVVREYAPDLITDVVELLVPSNMMCMVVAKAFDGHTTLTEPWYGAAYNKRRMDEAQVQELASGPDLPIGDDGGDPVVSRGLHLPLPNTFIPSDFTLVKPEYVIDAKVPVALLDVEGRGRLWYKHDNVFKQPKTLYQILLHTPVMSESALSAVLTDMSLRIITDQLTEYSYQAAIAGLHYSLTAQTLQSSVTVALQGYSHKLPVLAKTVLQAVSGFEVKDEALFERIKDKMVKDYANELLQDPYHLAMKELATYLYIPFTTQDKLDCAKSLTPDMLRAFYPRLIDTANGLWLEALVYGNASEADAVGLFAVAEDALLPPSPNTTSGSSNTHQNGDSISPTLFPVVELSSEEEVVVRAKVHNAEETNHGIQVVYQVGPQEVDTSARLDLLALLIKDEAFNQLRTKQQLGYVVFCTVTAADRYILALSFLVQSTHDPSVVMDRVEDFIHDMHTYLQQLTTQEFECSVKALVEQKLEKAKNYSEQGGRYWNELTKGTYMYDRSEVEAEAIKQLSKQDVLDFFHKYISGASSERRKVTAVMYGSSHPIPTTTDKEEEEATTTTAGSSSGDDGGKRKRKPVKVVEDPKTQAKGLPRYPRRPLGPVNVVPTPSRL